ncbi:hypothetical protein CTAYLR_003863 [Chrysophaeum taylorii]|uniref:PKS/mFAS DH domain-containing protein n=1 Tax=Chrysophaeum taylorii TaxID=2483200 RepID=A0AAD7UKF6_9STRA|nr:hypothetical protein CTAYLR_003863 [Chrysophaeum taylorii]
MLVTSDGPRRHDPLLGAAEAPRRQRRHDRVAASREKVQGICVARGLDDLHVAALNSPQSATMAGNNKSSALDSRNSYHSPYVQDAKEELLAEFRRALDVVDDGESTKNSASRWFSTVTAEEAEAIVTPGSLWAYVREPVDFMGGLNAALLSAAETDDFDCVVEIAARPTLGANVSQVSTGSFKKDPPPVFATGVDSKTYPNQTETEALLLVIGGLYVSGAVEATSFDWARLNGAWEVDTPADAPPPFKTAWAPADVAFRRDTKPWELMSYMPSAADAQQEALKDPLLRAGGRLRLATFPWAAEHVVAGNAIVPATAMIVLETLGTSQIVLEDVAIKSAIPVPSGDDYVDMRLEAGSAKGNVAVASNSTHCVLRPRLLAERTPPDADSLSLSFESRTTWPSAVQALNALVHHKSSSWRYLDKGQIYARCKAMGFDYGPQFARCTACYIGDDEAYSYVDASNCQAGGGFRWHPCVLDATFHSALVVLDIWSTQVVPVGVGAIEFLRGNHDGISDLVVRTVVTNRPSPACATFDIVVTYAKDLTMPLVAFKDLEIAPISKPPTSDLLTSLLTDESLFYVESQLVDTAKFDLNQIAAALETAATEGVSPADLAALADVRPRLAALVAADCRAAIRCAASSSGSRDAGSATKNKNPFFGCVERLAACSENYDQAFTPPPPPPRDAFDSLEREFPFYANELVVTRSVLTRLADVLADANAIGELMYEPQHLPAFFDRSISVDAAYDGVAAAVEQCVTTLLTQQPVVRVLEIGLRFGGLASRVAAKLAKFKNRCQYVATDLAATFFGDATEILDSSSLNTVHAQRFDLEQDPESQGFVPKSFDVAIITSTLHGVVDSAAALANVVNLAKPGAVDAQQRTNPSRVLLAHGALVRLDGSLVALRRLGPQRQELARQAMYSSR